MLRTVTVLPGTHLFRGAVTMPIGARIRTNFQRPDPTLVAGFQGLSASDVSDAAGLQYVVDPGIRHLAGARALLGVAFTVLATPGDHLMLQAALDLAQPGDVIVVSGGGIASNALVGENLVAWAARRGVAGFVIDGAVRDVDLLPLPTFARGATPRKSARSGPGEIGFAIGLGGVSISPGDIIVGDGDGVVVVPQAEAAGILERARKVAANNVAVMEKIAAGTWDRSWVQGALKNAGVVVEDE